MHCSLREFCRFCETQCYQRIPEARSSLRRAGPLLNDVRRDVEPAAATEVYFRAQEGPNGKPVSDESGRRRHPQRRLRNFGIARRWRHGPGVQGAQCVIRSHRSHESAAAESGRSERLGRPLHAGDQSAGGPAPSEYRRAAHGPYDRQSAGHDHGIRGGRDARGPNPARSYSVRPGAGLHRPGACGAQATPTNNISFIATSSLRT